VLSFCQSGHIPVVGDKKTDAFSFFLYAPARLLQRNFPVLLCLFGCHGLRISRYPVLFMRFNCISCPLLCQGQFLILSERFLCPIVRQITCQTTRQDFTTGGSVCQGQIGKMI